MRRIMLRIVAFLLGTQTGFAADSIALDARAALDDLAQRHDVMSYEGKPDGAAVGWGAGTMMRGSEPTQARATPSTSTK